MKRALLWLLGQAIASRPGFAAIKWFAQRRPHVHLHDLDGGLYMGRWRIVDEYEWVLLPNGKHVDGGKRTLASLVLEKLTGYSSIRLHHINRPDHDRDLHNHPFEYRTFIGKGFYSEEYFEYHDRTVPAHYRFVHAGSTATGHAKKYHRIDTVSVGGVWTIFCMKANTNEWGFMVGDKHVTSRSYFRRKGYTNKHRSEGMVS